MTAFKNFFFSFGKGKKIILTLVLVMFLGYLSKDSVLVLVNRKAVKEPLSNKTAIDKRTEVQPAKETFTLNREFSFDIKDKTGQVLGNTKYIIDNTELRDEIVIKGEKATALKGRMFLIINLKLRNDQSQTINMNTRNFVRLSVNGNDEWLAPEIYNDPVEIQPISTKYTRLGFPINDSDKDLKIQVGEVEGEKTVLDINLNR